MPKLYEITDAYTPEETIDSLPVEQPVLPTERPRIIINTAEFDKPKSDPLWDDVEGFKNKVKSGVSGIGDAIKYASELDQKFTSSIVNFPKKAYENSDDLVKGIKNLLGLDKEEERYQLWPEKVVKEALTSAGDIAKPNPYPEGSEQWQFYEDKRQEGMVPAAMAISALAGSGGLAGTGAKAGEVALGATPFLRPALKHKDKLYKGKPGQEHQDIIPKELYEDFRSKAMSGEDLAEYNFGFINDKGYFLKREDALKYGIDTGIIDPHAGKFGALTTTMGLTPKSVETQILSAPATKIGDKVYIGEPGEGHLSLLKKYGDVNIFDENKKLRSDFVAGFVDNNGKFISRKDAYDIANKSGQLKPKEQRQKFERENRLDANDVIYNTKSLTSTLMADSSKPGVAIEAVTKSAQMPEYLYHATYEPYYNSIKNEGLRGGRNKNYEDSLPDRVYLSRNPENARSYAETSDIVPEEFLDKIRILKIRTKDLDKSKLKIDKNVINNEGDTLEYHGNISPSSILMSDSSKEAAALQANKPAFYSAVEHTVKNIPQAKMTGEQWLGTLSNKPGVKPEELDWTGLKSFLEENKGKPVTKQQIEEHIASNKVELKEVNKTQQYNSNLENDPNFHGEGLTKYQSYQLPNGENYREMLLTLPNKKSARIDELDNQIAELYARKPRNSANFATAEDNRLFGDLTAERNKLLKIENQYKSSHWDEPNILAHVRMNDRNIDGKKSLHLEEIQSDWHQQGRDRGYATSPDTLRKSEKITTVKDADPLFRSGLKDIGHNLDKIADEKLYVYEHNGIGGYSLKEPATNETLKDWLQGANGVPDAPFKKTWHELALKRMIREAAEKGYDRLSWTPGEAQAARYDLSKQLKELQYLKNEDGTYSIAGVTKDGGGFNHPDNVPASKLPDIVGKEMAEKIVKNEGKRARGHPANGGYFEGVDLKIGGEGMKGFYDQIIPKSVNKIAKEYGAKVEKGKTSEGHDIFYIDLPEGLKNTALRKGFPLFSNAHPGFTFIPYTGNPFENSK